MMSGMSPKQLRKDSSHVLNERLSGEEIRREQRLKEVMCN